MRVDDASALETTLQRIRQRYALHFYLPADARAGQQRGIEVRLADASRRRYPDAELRFRKTYIAPDASGNTPDMPASSPDRADPAVISQSSPESSAQSGSSSDDHPTGLRRRRPAVDDSSGSRGPLTPDSSQNGGWRKTDGPPPASDQQTTAPVVQTAPATAAPASPAAATTPAATSDDNSTQKGGWRRVKPGEQP